MAESGANPKKARFLAALLDPANRTQVDAARAAGVPARTAVRWLADPVFQSDLRRAESDLVQRATRRLLALADRAVSVLAENMDPYSKPPFSIRASTAVLDRALQWRAENDHEARIAALEAAQYHGESED